MSRLNKTEQKQKLYIIFDKSIVCDIIIQHDTFLLTNVTIIFLSEID